LNPVFYNSLYFSSWPAVRIIILLDDGPGVDGDAAIGAGGDREAVGDNEFNIGERKKNRMERWGTRRLGKNECTKIVHENVGTTPLVRINLLNLAA
jgi:hypothetical protein